MEMVILILEVIEKIKWSILSMNNTVDSPVVHKHPTNFCSYNSFLTEEDITTILRMTQI